MMHRKFYTICYCVIISNRSIKGYDLNRYDNDLTGRNSQITNELKMADNDSQYINDVDV